MIDHSCPYGHNKCMKSLFLFCPLLFFTGCASYHPKTDTPVQKDTVYEKPVVKKTPVKRTQKSNKGVVWELLNREKLTLYFKSVDSGKNLTVIIGKGITQRSVPAGHWELTGFASEGRSFSSMNTSKKFVFRMRASSNIYAGSLVLGCPQISAQDYQYLKGMKFFNRYPFTSTHGLCEVVIGNDFAEVRNTLRKSRKNKNLDLVIGF